jgi:PAS domain-containing protein
MERDQARYQLFLESIDEYCWENDLKGRLIFANEKALDQFRFSRNPALQRYGPKKEGLLEAKVSYRTY